MLIIRITAIASCIVWLIMMSAAQAAPGPYAPGYQQRQHQQAHQHQHQTASHWNRWEYPRRNIRRHPSFQRDPLHRPPRYGEPVDHHQIYRERHQHRQGLPPKQRELHRPIRRN